MLGHSAAVKAVAFHPTDARVLASAACDKSVRVWDVASGVEAGIIRGHDGQGGCVCRMQGLQFNPECAVPRHSGEVLCVAWSPRSVPSPFGSDAREHMSTAQRTEIVDVGF